jgi:hypothetical protein
MAADVIFLDDKSIDAAPCQVKGSGTPVKAAAYDNDIGAPHF